LPTGPERSFAVVAVALLIAEGAYVARGCIRPVYFGIQRWSHCSSL
jgi:hypothetical protein